MRKLNFYVPDRQDERLKALSEKTGLSVSELIRRAIDAMLDREERKGRKGAEVH